MQGGIDQTGSIYVAWGMTSASDRFSPQAVAVLRALACAPDDWRYGLEIAGQTKLKSGSLYPILNRLEDRGLLEGRWLAPQMAGRPARHAYRITAAGRTALENATNNSASSLEEPNR